MKIEISVTIVYDCAGIDLRSLSNSAAHLVGTLRYDTDGDGTDAVLFGQFPPDDKPRMVCGKMWTPEGEAAQGLLAHMPCKTDEKIIAKAKRYPGEYLVGTDAGWGIKAGSGIEAGEGIEAGDGIKAGLAIIAKFVSVKLRIFVGLCMWRLPTAEETELRAELRKGILAFGTHRAPTKE